MSAELEVITPSYGPDLPLFRDLHRSVRHYAPPDTRHQVIVPRSDTAAFSRMGEAPALTVTAESTLIPRSFVPVPGRNLYVNLRRPWPPVRGWITQQILKLAAAAGSDSDIVLLVDSDIFLVRPVGLDTFVGPAGAHFYVKDGEIDDRLPRHVEWHRVSRRILGLPPVGPGTRLPDYVSSFTVWRPTVVRDMLQRIETVTRRPWVDTVAGCLHFSEFILYGVYVDEVLGREHMHASDRMLCHSYWDEAPLDADAARSFAASLADDDVAVMISAKSRTTDAVRRSVREAVSA